MKWKTAGCIFHSIPVSRAHDVCSIWFPFKDAMYRTLVLKIPSKTPCSDLQFELGPNLSGHGCTAGTPQFPFKDAMYRALALKTPLRTPCSDLQYEPGTILSGCTAGTPQQTPHTNSENTSVLCSISPQTVWIGNMDSSVVWVLDRDWMVAGSRHVNST